MRDEERFPDGEGYPRVAWQSLSGPQKAAMMTEQGLYDAHASTVHSLRRSGFVTPGGTGRFTERGEALRDWVRREFGLGGDDAR